MKRIKFRLKNKNKKCSTSYINNTYYRKFYRMLCNKRKERKIWIMYFTKNKSEFHKSQIISYNRTIKKLIKLMNDTAIRLKGKQ